MKIVCESCGTKYSIADEKVSGKVFKLRCKKCSHVIVVKGNGESEAAPQETPAPAAAEPVPEPAAAAAPDAVWHLVIDREQVGPMTAEEVRAKFAAGQVDAESYIWREGFEDWLKLASVDGFQDLATQQRSNGESNQATQRADADLFRNHSPEEEPAPTADLFGGGAGHAGMTASPNAQTIMAGPSASPFTSASSGRSSSSGPVSESAGGSSVEVKSMTGARSENSVLFSLNNLQALATGGGASGGGAPAPSAGPKAGYASSQSEGSGLIDIRAMAAQTLSASSFSVGTSSKPDELPLVNEAPMFSPVAPAVLMPISEPTGMPKWVWGVVGLGGAIVVGMVAVIVLVLRAPQPVAQLTPPPSSGPAAQAGGETPKVTPQPGGTQPAAQAGTDSGAKAPVKDDAAAAGADPEKRRRPRDKGEKADRGEKVGARPQGQKETPAAAATPSPPPAAETPKPAKPKKKDDLDDLLDSATGGASGGKPKGESSKKDAPEQLSMDTIKGVLKSVNSAVQGCGAGTYVVKLTIGKSGRISDASVPGKAGDSAADCVVKAVKGSKFPEFTGDPQTLSYPFIVR